MGLVLPIPIVVILACLTVFVAPVWRWSRGWSWAPFGMLAMGLATLVVFALTVAPE